MDIQAEMADYEARAELAYAAMYEAAPHNVKDCYEDACRFLAHAIEITIRLGLIEEAKRLKRRNAEISAVYNHRRTLSELTLVPPAHVST